MIDPAGISGKSLEPWKDMRKALERLVYDDKVIYAYAIAKDKVSILVQILPTDSIQAEDAVGLDLPGIPPQVRLNALYKQLTINKAGYILLPMRLLK